MVIRVGGQITMQKEEITMLQAGDEIEGVKSHKDLCKMCKFVSFILFSPQEVTSVFDKAL
jgi:hypothetical protein